MPHVEMSEFDDKADRGESTASAAARVARARHVQLARQGVCNARLADSQIERLCRPDKPGGRVLELAMKRLGLSARARGRILKIARTIADLDGEESLTASHVSQAIMLRTLDRTRPEASASD
jgi:magnesium chelatase family protein